MWLSTVADRTLQGIAALSWLLVQVASLRERGLVPATPGSTHTRMTVSGMWLAKQFYSSHPR